MKGEFIFTLIIGGVLFFSSGSLVAQALCTNGPSSCPSATDPCFKVSAGAGTDCAIHVSGTCINFYTSGTTGGMNCRNGARMCTCINLNIGFTFTGDFFFGSNTAPGVGDGLAFVLRQGDAAGVGGMGGSIGYHSLTGPWVAVEFDTYQNGGTDAWGTDDPACQHSAVYSRTSGGTYTTLRSPTCLGGGAFDARNTSGTTYAVSITWDPSLNRLTVRWNGSILYTVNNDIRTLFSDPTCVKYHLTTGTGGARQNHRVCNPALTVALPVSLVSFTGQLLEKNKVMLNWETATETDNKEFTILRSTDAENWQPVAVVEGAGYSFSPRKYSYTDEILPGYKTVYYRLKQTDYDGSSEVFGIISVDLSPGNNFRIIPNPASGTFRMIFDQSLGEDIHYSILNVHGEPVQPASSEIFENEIQINGENLPEGIYFLHVISQGNYSTGKLMISK